VTARHCAGVAGKTDGFNGGSQREYRSAKDSDLEVTEMWVGRQVAAGSCDETKDNGTDCDSHAHGELHDGGEESVRAGHTFRGISA